MSHVLAKWWNTAKCWIKAYLFNEQTGTTSEWCKVNRTEIFGSFDGWLFCPCGTGHQTTAESRERILVSTGSNISWIEIRLQAYNPTPIKGIVSFFCPIYPLFFSPSLAKGNVPHYTRTIHTAHGLLLLLYSIIK